MLTPINPPLKDTLSHNKRRDASKVQSDGDVQHHDSTISTHDALAPELTMFIDGYTFSDGIQLLNVQLSNCDACLVRIVELGNDLAPGIHNESMAIALTLSIVSTRLCCRNHKRLRQCNNARVGLFRAFAHLCKERFRHD